MQKEIIEDALNEAIYLLSNELRSLVDEELIEEYSDVIQKLELALLELNK